MNSASSSSAAETTRKNPVEENDVELAKAISLPPLPQPDYTQKRNEAKCGIFSVLFIVAIVLALTHGVALNDRIGSLPPPAYWVCFGVIHAMAFIALICLERVIRADPGIIKRSPQTCEPIPDVIRERLEHGLGLDDLRNLYDDSKGSYCVRCCVWRPPKRCVSASEVLSS